MKVKNAMHSGVEACHPDSSAKELASIMQKFDVGAVPVIDGKAILGMITDRDIVCRAVAKGKDLSNLKARDIMSGDVIFCTENEEVEDAIRLMEDKQIRRLPVMDARNHMTGMLSLGDVSHILPHELSGELIEKVAAHHSV